MSAIRLIHGNLYADILRDRRGALERWLYVVQREGSPDILAMGSCTSESAARESATRSMEELQRIARPIAS